MSRQCLSTDGNRLSFMKLREKFPYLTFFREYMTLKITFLLLTLRRYD